MLHQKCGTRLKQQYICPTCEEVVPRDDVAKGYEFAKDQYVKFTADEFKAIEAPKTDGIEITEFVPADQVEAILLDKPYYLGPDKGGARAYRLLSTALRESGRVAIAKYATRGKQYLVMLRPHREGLVMDQLHYADEVRTFDEVPLGEAEVKPAELQLAKQLIEQSASDSFDPKRYTDEVRVEMQALIQKKIDGEEITIQPAAEVAPKVIDLMAALKASIEGKAAGAKAAVAASEQVGSGRKGRRKAAGG